MIPEEVRQFLHEWLEGDDGVDTLEWFIHNNLLDAPALRKQLLKIANTNYHEAKTHSGEDREYFRSVARRAEAAAKLL